jgi:DNA-binding transcriptional ArsR family regulator
MATADLVAARKGVLSPSQIADELELPIGNVSYHVRVLADADLIELVDEIPRRGALEHLYRAKARGELNLVKIPTARGPRPPKR